MMNPIGLGLAMAATASLGFAGTNGDPTKNDPLLDSLFQSNVTVKYKPGSGVTFQGEKDDFSLNISGRLQAKWYYTSNDNGGTDINTFAVRRARTKLMGNVWSKDITYYVQFEHAAAPDVLDGFVGWNFWHNDDAYIGVNLGLQKFRSGLQADNSSGSLEINERSMATNTFANGRATGALFHGGFGKADNGHSLLWHLGLMNNDNAAGSALNSALGTNESNKLDWTLGVMWAGEGSTGPTSYTEGDLAHNGKLEPVIGANLMIGKDTFGGTAIDTTTINIYAGAKFGNGLAAQGEVWIRKDDPTGGTKADSNGWYLQASYTTAPGEGTQWAFIGRVSMVTIDDVNPLLTIIPSMQGTGTFAAVGTGDITEIQGGVSAYYHEHKLKSQVMVTFQSLNPDAGTDADNVGIDVMATLAF